jgi:hypothetical protein
MHGFITKKQIYKTDCKRLADQAEGYFQWAYTVCEAISQLKKPGQSMRKRIHEFLSVGPSDDNVKALDNLYKFVLESVFDANDEECMSEYKRSMSLVLSACIPLSQSSLNIFQSAYAHQGELEEVDEDTMIQYLGSLLTGVHERNIPIRPVHTSIRDFLLDKKRSGIFSINLDTGNSILCVGSLRLMTKELHFNMGQWKTSYLFNEQQGSDAHQMISQEVLYACQYWSNHLTETVINDDLNGILDLLGSFFVNFSLYWMEVLGMLNGLEVIKQSVERAGKLLENLVSIVKENA